MPTLAELEAKLDHIRASPRDAGRIELIVRRPSPGEREVVDEATLEMGRGLVGDSWIARPSRHTADGSPNPDQMLTLMNARAIAALADRERWPIAGDQLFVDFDLAEASVPAGTRLSIGTALLEISPKPHTGCAKFTERFGSDATKWLNTEAGRALHLRGVHAVILASGTVRVGDAIVRI